MAGATRKGGASKKAAAKKAAAKKAAAKKAVPQKKVRRGRPLGTTKHVMMSRRMMGIDPENPVIKSGHMTVPAAHLLDQMQTDTLANLAKDGIINDLTGVFSTDDLIPGGANDTALHAMLPIDRARQLLRTDSRYAEEFVLKVVHTLTLAGTPVDRMAQLFGVAPRTIHRWRTKLREVYRKTGTSLDGAELVGECMQELRSLKQRGWQMISTGKSVMDQRAGAEVVRGALGDMMKIMQACGIFENPELLKGKVGRENSAEAGATTLRGMIGDIFTNDSDFTRVPRDAQIVDDKEDEYDPALLT